MKREIKRRYPIGAELIGENETHFRVWAPKARKIDIVIDGGDAHTLEAEADGYFFGSTHARATATAFASTAARKFIPTQRLAGNRMGRTAYRRLSIQRNSNGTTQNGAACSCPAKSFTNFTSARLRRKERGAPRRRSCRSCAMTGSRCWR